MKKILAALILSGLAACAYAQVPPIWVQAPFGWTRADGGNPVGGGGGGSVPTGTGFRHVTGGAEDAASKTVDVSSGDITGVLACTSFPALTGAVTTSAGSCATTSANSTAYTQRGNMTGSAAAPVDMDPLDNRWWVWKDDFCTNTTNMYKYLGANTGGGTTSVTAVQGTPCVQGFQSGTGTGDVSTMVAKTQSGAGNSIVLGGGYWDVRTNFSVNALSDGANATYDLFYGWQSTITAGEPNDGCYFWSNDARNTSTAWKINCRKGGTGVAVSCGINVATGQQSLRITVDQAASAAHFYVGSANGGQGTECSNSPITTNIPNTNDTDLQFKIAKSAFATSRTVTMDYWYMMYVSTTSR